MDRRQLILLGLLTFVTLFGPLLLFLVLMGGQHRGGLPDRPIEWITLAAVCGAAFVLFVATLAVSLSNLRQMKIEDAEARARRSGGDAP